MDCFEVLSITANCGFQILRLALLDVVLLFLSFKELEDPVVLNFDVRRQTFFEED